MTTTNYLDGRVEYARPQAILFANNSGTLQSKYTATGKTASLSALSTTIAVLNGLEGIKVGQLLEKTSGTGEFGVGAKVVSINTLMSTITVSVPNQTSGNIVFKTGSTSYVPEGTEFSDFLILSDHSRSPLEFSPERIEKRERMVNGRMRSYHVADKMKLSISWTDLPSRAFSLTPNFDSSGNTVLSPYTVDGGAGGNDLLKWYEDNVGSFWVYVAYDKYTEFGNDNAAYGHMHQYNQVLEMYISDFSHKVNKRGKSYDMWDVSITLEEA